MGFDSFAVVDWSAGNDTGPNPRKDAIWAGVVVDSVPLPPRYLRNRVQAKQWLEDLIRGELAAGRQLAIGFDFPFGYPKGFSRAVTGEETPLAIWDHFSAALLDTPKANSRFDLAADLNRRFEGVGPFWFNALRRDIPDLPRLKSERTVTHGFAERRVCEKLAKGTFTCWQMGGAGSVGGQAMTGMAVLSSLRRLFPGQVSVWPFETLERPVTFFEVWPSLIADAVRSVDDPIKDRAQVRLLSEAFARLPVPQFHRMIDVDAPVEGWILGIGHEDELRSMLCPV